MNSSVFIIAEAGVNHNGNNDFVFRLIDAAVAAGADAIKFQTFKTDNMVTKKAEKAGYQKETSGQNESQYEMLKKLELSYEIHYELKEYCIKNGIHFLSTAFDFESLKFLVNDLAMSTLKISSGEITNGPLLLAHAETKLNLIISTGMATIDEIRDALSVIAYGLIESKKSPSSAAFRDAFNSDIGQQALIEKVTLLHCTTEYPAPIGDINLNAMRTLHDTFGLKVGYSDHSEGITVPIAATSLGAVLIEKHFTLDKSLPGPDHKASLNPDELCNMVTAIRQAEKAMGSGRKEPAASEMENRDIARKSLIAAKEIKQGELFTFENLTIKRPGTGISPMSYWDILGNKSTHSYEKEELIR
ncbi:N-acetylneuraminate synthase [hydrothermal vent metagenome]|uniref:N-acetylneuraminate synthase n=1 Tax=hydrothermal vent metagenome TaxID=652676 RepID=A0A3B0Y5Y1_9ZZZZ